MWLIAATRRGLRFANPCRGRRSTLLLNEIAAALQGRRTMQGRRKRSTVAAWLGLVALAIQAVLPLLVAVEISLAAGAGENSVFELCEYGHVHAAAPHEADGAPGKSHHRDGGDGAICPICIALHAGPVFTAPAILALPLPTVREIATALPEMRRSPRLVALVAYRSRAPPIG
jgi:hypothetical protein